MRRSISRQFLPERQRSSRRFSRIGLLSLVAFVLALASCGAETATESTVEGTSAAVEQADDSSAESAEPETETEESGPVVPEPDEVVLGDFPSVNVSNVGTGETVNLQQTLSGGDTPILLWFYAPH